MKFSKVVLAVTIGFVGGVVLVETCPQFKQMVEKGKKMLNKNKN